MRPAHAGPREDRGPRASKPVVSAVVAKEPLGVVSADCCGLPRKDVGQTHDPSTEPVDVGEAPVVGCRDCGAEVTQR